MLLLQCKNLLHFHILGLKNQKVLRTSSAPSLARQTTGHKRNINEVSEHNTLTQYISPSTLYCGIMYSLTDSSPHPFSKEKKSN